jgi:hypothetical protein
MDQIDFDSNIYYLKGYFFYRQEILKEIKKHFNPFDLYVFDKDTNHKYVEKVLMEGSCFGNKKFIILNDWPGAKAKTQAQSRTKVLKWFKKILLIVPDDCILVLNNLKTSSKPLLAEIKKVGKIFEREQEVKQYQAKKCISEYFEKREKVIQQDDMDMIIKSLGITSYKVDIDRLLLLLKQIDNYVGKRKNIKTEDIAKVCIQSESFIMWSLYKAFDEKDINMSFYLIKMFLSSAKNVQTQASMIINFMIWRYKLLWFVKECQGEGLKQEEIWNKLSNLDKLSRSGSDFFTIMSDKDKDGISLGSLYSKKMFNTLFNSFQGAKIVLEKYKSDELLLINYALSNAWSKLRSIEYVRDGFDDYESDLILKVLCLVACRSIKKISSIKFLKNKSLLKVG